MRRRERAAAVTVAALAAVAGCGDTPAGTVAVPSSPVTTPPDAVRPAPTATSTVPPTAEHRPCPPAGVLVTAGPVDGALGLRAVTLRVTNCGRRSYTVAAYPDVAVLDGRGRPVPVDVTRGTRPGDPAEDPGPRTTVLRRGQSAEAGFLWRLEVEASDVDDVTGPLTVDPGAGQEPQAAGLDVDLGTTRRVTVTAWHRPKGR